MTTLKSCSIDDQYKHVSFKDLEKYLAKDDYLSGYCETEKELVRQNLGIETYKVDSKLSDLSTNPVENRVIANALKGKADIDKLPKVALTGNYCDLIHKPHFLPNPEFLVIVDSNGTVGYNGENPVKVKLPTHMSELTNDVGYLTQATCDERYVKGVIINGDTTNIIWPERGIVDLNLEEYTGVDHKLSLTSIKPVQNKVVTRAFEKIKELFNKVVKKLNDLEDVTDAEHPENGQLLVYVKPNEDCDGYWKPGPKPTNAGDILVFNGTEWEIKNISEIVGECLWTINNGELIPNKAVIDQKFGINYNGTVATNGAIYSGQN